MNSLQELNTFGSEALDVLDNRPSSVKFNREYPLTAQDQTFTAVVDPYGGPTFQPISPGIEIVEIINYQTANVRYSINIKPGSTTPLTGSAIIITSTLPSGASVSTGGGLTTISGIHSVSDWDQVKNFTWQLPSNFNSFPLWYLEVSVTYYDSALAQDVSKSWVVYDDRFYYITELEAQATFSSIIGVNSPAAAALTGAATAICDTKVIVDFTSNISANAAFTSDVNVNVDYLAATGLLSGTIRFTADTPVSMGATANLSCTPVISVTGLSSRTYTANQGNKIFGTNTPIISTPSNGDTVSITISSSLGYFTQGNTTIPTGSITLSGFAYVVNALLENVYFYPNYGISSSGTITWAQSRNGTLEFTRNIPVTGIFASIPTTRVTLTSSQTWKPTIDQVYYNSAQILIVGGGGGGSHTGGGGGGGVRLTSVQTLNYVDYTVTIGQGGTQGSDYTADFANNAPASIDVSGSDGGTSSFVNSSLGINYTAAGGQGARAIYTRTSPSPNYKYDNINVSGGNSPGYIIPSGSNGTQAGVSAIGNFDIIQDNWLYISGLAVGSGAWSGFQWTSFLGQNQYYGVGGGAVGIGRNNGGGAGAGYINFVVTPTGQPGVANTGGGGGGGLYRSISGVPTAAAPGPGGSGVVIVQFQGYKP